MALLKAITLAEKNDYALALETLEAANPNNLLVLKLKGDCYFGLNRFNDALAAYFTINKTAKDEITLEIARAYAMKGNNEDALTWLEKHLARKNKSSEYAIVTDKAFEKLLNTKEWKNLWKKDWYSQSEIQRNAIESLLDKGNSETALEELEKDQSRSLIKHEYYALQAKAYSQLKQWEMALDAINHALELQRTNESYWKIRGDIYFEVADYSKATEDYTKTLNINPYIVSLYLKRAEAARLSGNTDLAAEDMDVYQQIYPKAPETIFELGKLEATRENYSVSLAYFNKLLTLHKGNPLYYAERAAIEMKIEDYHAADEDFGMALDLNPSLKEAYLNKGKIRIYLLDNESACFNFEKARNLGSAEAAKLYVEHCTK